MSFNEKRYQEGGYAFNRCDGKDIYTELVRRDELYGNQSFYISPEEYKYIVAGNDGSCTWPKCDCKLSSVDGVFRQEKIDWLVSETLKDPKFKSKIRI